MMDGDQDNTLQHGSRQDISPTTMVGVFFLTLFSSVPKILVVVLLLFSVFLGESLRVFEFGGSL